jgi:hypothetical protein
MALLPGHFGDGIGRMLAAEMCELASMPAHGGRCQSGFLNNMV